MFCMLADFLNDLFQLEQSSGISPVFDFWCVLGYQMERKTFHTVDIICKSKDSTSLLSVIQC